MSDVDVVSPYDKHNDHALYVDPEHIVLKSGRHLVGEPALATWRSSKRSIAVNALGDSGALIKAHDHSDCLATFVALAKDAEPRSLQQARTRAFSVLRSKSASVGFRTKGLQEAIASPGCIDGVFGQVTQRTLELALSSIRRAFMFPLSASL